MLARNVALILGPFQFIQGLHSRYLTLHKMMGRIYALGCVTGVCGGLLMATRAYGGFPSTAGFGMLAVLWLITIAFALTRARQGKIDQHREWVVRSFALTLAAFTLRLIWTVHAVLEANEVVSTPFVSIYQATAWLCWVPNLIAAEWYINASRA